MFSSAEKAEAYNSAPARYADADLFDAGNCIVTFIEEGDRKAGAPEIGTFYKDRRYIFQTQEKRERFLADPNKYVDAVALMRKEPPSQAPPAQ